MPPSASTTPSSPCSASNAGANGPAPKEGCFYTVTANGTNTLTVDLNGDDLSTVQPGTRVTLIPYWTMGTAFPASDAGRSFVASASDLASCHHPSDPPDGNLQLRHPQSHRPTFQAIWKSHPAVTARHYYFCCGGVARRAARRQTVVCDDDLLYPDAHFIVRNTATTALTFRPPGAVLMGRITVPVPTSWQEDSQSYFPVALPRPLAVDFNDSGLAASGAVGDSNGESVAVFDPVATGYNQAPSASYFLSGGVWRKQGAPATQDFGLTPLAPGSGLILHKMATDGTTVFWQNAPNYLVAQP